MEEVPIVPNVKEDVSVAITIISPETPISRLGFSQRSFNALTKNGYNTVALLLTLDEEALKTIENLGKKSIKEIRIVQEQLQRQTKMTTDDHLENVNVPDCRFIYTRETIYPTDYIGVLDISLKAHKVLYDAGIFSVGKLFNLDEEAVYSLAKTTKKFPKNSSLLSPERSLSSVKYSAMKT